MNIAKYSHFARRRKMKGATILDVLLAGGIIAFVIVGVVSLFNSAFGSTKLNQAQSQLMSYVSGTKTLYASQDSYSGLTEAVLIQAGKAPSNAVRGTGLVNPWGGTTTITGSADYFDIEFSGVPDDACVNFATSGTFETGGVYEININAATTSYDRTNPPTPSSLVTDCSNGSNTIRFRAR